MQGGIPLRLACGAEFPAGAYRGQQLALHDRRRSTDDLESQSGQLALMPPSEARQDLQQPGTPSPSKSESSSGLSPEAQSERFLAALKGNAHAELEDDADAQAAAPAGKSKAKGKAKAKAKGKAKAKAGAKDKAAPKAAVAKPAVDKNKLVFNPTYNLEATRSQYQCRPGLPFSVCGESSASFPFAKYGGKAGAERAAKKWVKDFKASHKCK